MQGASNHGLVAALLQGLPAFLDRRQKPSFPHGQSTVKHLHNAKKLHAVSHLVMRSVSVQLQGVSGVGQAAKGGGWGL